MTSDDNHDDDAQLQQLRAVWVSMRDEDPPERGLASLMAAARTKAAELEHAASPSWLQRIAATLRRPPVLALATVTLLFGGALLVTQRSSQMKVDATAVDESSSLDTTDPRAKGESAAPATGSSAVTERGVESPAAATVETKPAAPIAEPVAEPRTSTVPKAATKSRPKAMAPSPTTTENPDLDASPPGPGFESGWASGAGAASPPVLSIAQDDARAAPPEAQNQAPKKPLAGPPSPSSEAEDRVISKDAAKPTLDQLVKQCETAAARGDCTAVRAIAQKILITAPAAYKRRVTSNAAINRCMPAPSPNSVAE